MEIAVYGLSASVPVVVFCVRGDINAMTYEQLQEQARQAIERGARAIVLDLAEVPYMSSAGLRVVNYMFHAMRTDAVEDSDTAIRAGMKAGTYRSSHVKIARPTPRVKETLQLAGIDHFIDLYDELDAAMNSFG